MAKQSYPKNRLREVLHSRRLNMQAIDLIEKLLALEPGKRIDAMQAAEVSQWLPQSRAFSVDSIYLTEKES